MTEPTTDESGQTEYRQLRFARPPGSTELLIIRHGESQAAKPDKPFPTKDGHGDPPLAEFGRWQAERLADRLEQVHLDAIYVTSLQRTHQTAAPLAARIGLAPIEEPDLREVHLGEWDNGLYRKMAAEGHPLMLEAAEKEDWGVLPGAESAESVRNRVLPAFGRIVAAHPDQTVAVVVHGGVIGCYLADVTSSRPMAFVTADNASISHVIVDGDRRTLRRFNDTGHLEGELSTETDPPAVVT